MGDKFYDVCLRCGATFSNPPDLIGDYCAPCSELCTYNRICTNPKNHDGVCSTSVATPWGEVIPNPNAEDYERYYSAKADTIYWKDLREKLVDAEELYYGRKADKGKPRPSLLPVSAMRALTRVFEYGAEKYSEGSWREVENAEERYLEAALRHMWDHLEGIEKDPDGSGLWSLDQACWNLFVLIALREEKSKRALAKEKDNGNV